MIYTSEYERKGKPSGEPGRTEEQERYAQIELNIDDFELIDIAMKNMKVRCLQNAAAAMNNGYGSESSRTRAEIWNKRAKKIDNIMSRIIEEMS